MTTTNNLSSSTATSNHRGGDGGNTARNIGNGYHHNRQPEEEEEEVSIEVLKDDDDDDGYYYLSNEARQNLPNYNYKGCDNSLLYIYILSPLAQWSVDNLVPKSTAPNTITLIGLLWMITSYGIYWYYVPSVGLSSEEDESTPPTWIFVLNGISMLIYQTLDNMDGKQARRTGSSSPLGLIFDHGCDALNSIFGSTNWIIGLGLNPSKDLLACWVIIFGPMVLFNNTTWEQYYIGELILPIVNGPNEGLLGGAILSFMSALYGPSFWQQQQNAATTIIQHESILKFFPPNIVSSISTLRNCDLLLIGCSIGFVQEIFLKCIPVSFQYRGAGLALVPFITLATSYAIIGYLQPGIWLNLPRTSLHLASILFVDMNVDLMIAHVTDQKYQWFRWQLLPLVGLTMWTIFLELMNTETSSTDEESINIYLLTYTSGLAVYVTMKCTLLIHEACNVLGIWCFDIVTPHPSKSKNKTKSNKVMMYTNSNGHAKLH